MSEYKRHPWSAGLGDIEGDSFNEMVADVREHGFRDRLVWLKDGQIVDGWQRHRVLCVLEAEGTQWGLHYVEWKFDDAELQSRIISLNRHRRHATKEPQDDDFFGGVTTTNG